ncbi:type II toxin-antitoxin system YoeB family toxin [Candidatus Azambacteria bacterium]|nr:type II toxin-antitoxin system YoeB family toxin [Candidatus Azambacteria bacterium]
MKLKVLRNDLIEYLVFHGLEKKWKKASRLFEENIKHPSLETELLEPHWRGIYSFRIDKKYRSLFFIKDGIVEVFKITNHYKK